MDEYQNRHVAFLDILGFSDLIQKSITCQATFEKILDITKGLATAGNEIATTYGWQVDAQDIVCTAFSDSIVISVPEGSRIGSLYSLAFAVIGLCRKLLVDVGVAARGGIATGPAYHRDGIVFGPSYIAAYKLESQTAKMARIVVDAAMAQRWTEGFGNQGGLLALKDVIRQDRDGASILDIFHFPARDSIDKSTADFFRRAGPAISGLMAEEGLDAGALSQLMWLATHYNQSSMRGRLNLPAISGWCMPMD